MIREISDREFDRAVETSELPVLVEFWQPGCGGCRALRMELEKIEQEVGKRLLILTMNVQENYQVPAELDVTSLPALALYRNGQFVGFIGGLGKKDEILKQLNAHLSWSKS